MDAIRALGICQNLVAEEPLLRVMNSFWTPWADRLQAAAALCALQNAEGAAYLESKLTSVRAAQRAAAIHFLGESRHPRALELLEPIALDKSDRHQDVAVRTLGLLTSPDATQMLERLRALNNDEALQADIDHALQRTRH